jgi:hypothetical protein
MTVDVATAPVPVQVRACRMFNSSATRGLLLVVLASLGLGYLVARASTPLLLVVPMLPFACWLLLESPAISVGTVLLLSSILGNPAAHILVAGLPLLEILLCLGTIAAVFRASMRPSPTNGLRATLLWLPAWTWGVLLFAFRNHSNAISGLRDSFIFLYPLLFIAPLSALSATRFRLLTPRYAAIVPLVAFIVCAIGLHNLATGHSTVTSTGQARVLGSWFAPPLVASLLVATYMYQIRQWNITKTLLASAPVLGLLLVNHRSAYLGLLTALCVFVLLGPTGVRKPSTRSLAKVALVGGVLGFGIIAATPQGRGGVQRFLSSTNLSDPNIADRLSRDQHAIPTTGRGWVIGDGVGLQTTASLAAATTAANVDNPDAYQGTHNSFATLLHLGGIVGLILVIGPLSAAYLRALRWRADPMVRMLLSFLAFSLMFSAFNVVLEDSYIGAWVWGPVGILWCLSQAKGRRLSAPRGEIEMPAQ